jgi:phosphatidylglycerol:prolipoprotein diacylglycerol transferase
MKPELFTIPFLHRPLHSYGLMMVIGFFLALQLAHFLARRSRLDPEVFVNAGLIALLSGIVGARLSHVIENWSDYTIPELTFGENLWNAVNLTSGGLTYYGGFLLAFPVTVLYGVMKKVPLRVGMDIIAPCVLIGLGFGRVGCFLNGCCYGAPTDLPGPFAVRFPYHSNAYIDQFNESRLTAPFELTDMTRYGLRLKKPEVIAKDPQLQAIAARERALPVHNAQIYSTITALLLAALLTAYFTLPHVPGRVFALMMILEGATRFLLELLRAEPRQVGPLTLSEFIGLLLVAGGIAAWFLFPLPDRGRRPTPALVPA